MGWGVITTSTYTDSSDKERKPAASSRFVASIRSQLLLGGGGTRTVASPTTPHAPRCTSKGETTSGTEI